MYLILYWYLFDHSITSSSSEVESIIIIIVTPPYGHHEAPLPSNLNHVSGNPQHSSISLSSHIDDSFVPSSSLSLIFCLSSLVLCDVCSVTVVSLIPSEHCVYSGAV